MQINNITDIDQWLLLSMSGGKYPFFEGCISAYAMPCVWIPMLLAVLYVLLKNNNLKEFITITSLLITTFALTYTIAEFAMQPLFDNLSSLSSESTSVILKKETSLLINSANAFAIALFLSMLIRHNALTLSLLIWVGIGCYTEYHTLACYPKYILSGAVIGIICGLLAYKLFKYILSKQRKSRRDWISNRFTKSGYEVPDVYFLLVVLYGTFAALPIISFIVI